jgi:hypothetical protein
MNAVVIESDDSYEPDCEDLAYQLYKDREFEQWVSWIREFEDQCRASTKPDRELRNMNKERKALARELWQDVARVKVSTLASQVPTLNWAKA